MVGYTEAGDSDVDPDPVDPVECTVYKWWHTCEGGARRQLQDANGYENYWKIQNSWGTDWGDQGFVLFEISEGDGVCGMNSYIEWAEM